jgi:Ca2+-transporting ATPase
VKSALYRKVSAKLTTPYNVMTTFFFRRSVEKAFQMDEYPSGLSLNMNKSIDANAPYIILAVDTVMYIFNAVVQKSISTSQRDVIASVLPTIGRVLEADFIGMLQRKMRDEAYPKPTVSGGLPPEENIIQFIVLTNSLDMSIEYLTRITSGRLGASVDGGQNGAESSSLLTESFPFERDVIFVANALGAVEGSFVRKTSELMNEGIQVLLKEVIKPRLRLVLNDTFWEVDYMLTEDAIAEIARQTDEEEEDILEQVPRRFTHGWEQLMKPIARLMTPATFDTLLNSTARYLAKFLEKRLFSFSGRTSGFGAIRIERDFTGIVNTVAKGDYGVREAFLKVTQLLMVANMEDDEWQELVALEGDDGVDWVLNEEEKRKARSLVRE